MAGMISLAFVEEDSHTIVRKAASLIHPDSPYRKCLDMVIAMADSGRHAGTDFSGYRSALGNRISGHEQRGVEWWDCGHQRVVW